jgi:hypothetical protein
MGHLLGRVPTKLADVLAVCCTVERLSVVASEEQDQLDSLRLGEASEPTTLGVAEALNHPFRLGLSETASRGDQIDNAHVGEASRDRLFEHIVEQKLPPRQLVFDRFPFFSHLVGASEGKEVLVGHPPENTASAFEAFRAQARRREAEQAAG